MEQLPLNAAHDTINTKVGKLSIMASDEGLHALLWERDRTDPSWKRLFEQSTQNSRHPIIQKTKRQLEEYFAGKRSTFDIKLKPYGTEFQQKTWLQLRKIPYGTTISYSEQAARLGDKRKARAVGMANGKNPISVIVPCHRVIGADGSLTGFGGGLKTKQFLLDLERRVLGASWDSTLRASAMKTP